MGEAPVLEDQRFGFRQIKAVALEERAHCFRANVHVG
jgi:hypothetical protein